ncbi:MAG: hypothetical protein JWO36_6432 [Myxococcales bacterium]|nr:hypothetical protein [Myxococcales bacterium]
METNEPDDKLANFDLSAWEVPAVPSVADAVLSRLSESAAAVAVEGTERPRRKWSIGAAAAVLVGSAAAFAVVVERGAHHAGADHGELVASKAQHLDLDTVTVDLDASAAISWKRDSNALVVQQRGAATWHVAGGDKLRIETGAMLAPVEATGASLRVETHMNRSDARLIGAGVVTAVTAALVTVVVYEGHVKVAASNQTVSVEPGTTVEIRPNQPPTPPDLVGADDELRDLQAKLEVLEDENAKLREQAVAGGSSNSCDEVSCVLTNYAASCCAKFRIHPDELDAGTVAAAVKKVVPDVHACGAGTVTGKIVVKFTIDTHGSPDKVDVRFDDAVVPDASKFATCVAGAVSKARFPALRRPQVVRFPFVFDDRKVSTTCDAAALAERGKGEVNTGAFAAAIASFEASLQCKQDPVVDRLAFMAACRAKNVAKAKHYYGKLPPQTRDTLIEICIASDIDPRTAVTDSVSPKPACDADALADKGRNNIDVSAFAAALANFEASLACKPDPSVYKLAFMAACRGSNLAKAKQYYGKLPTKTQETMVHMCLINKIDPRSGDVPAGYPPVMAACQPQSSYDPFNSTPMCPDSGTPQPASTDKSGYLAVMSRPAAKILIDNVDTGLTTPITRLPLTPGKHRLTFVIDENRYTYAIVIKAGETLRMTKSFE